MRSLLTGAALVAGLAFFGAASVYADHAYVFGGVNFFRGAGAVTSEYVSNYTTCSGISCAVTVALGKRDYARFLKWCGSASRAVTVSPGAFGGYVECKGASPWYLNAHVAMRNAKDVLTTHSEAVTITINVTP